MSNDLVKRQGATTFIPGRPGSAGFAGSPAVPGGWRLRTEEERMVQLMLYGQSLPSGWRLERMEEMKSGQNFTDWENNTGHGSSAYYVGIFVRTVTYWVYVAPVPAKPAIAPEPGVPDQTLTEYYEGWNAGAYSAKSKEGNFEARFKVFSGSRAVVVGLNPGPQGVTPNMPHALAFSAGKVSVQESSATKSALRPWVQGDEFAIRRSNGKVSYLHNGRTFYTSALASSGAVHLDAALYYAQDAVLEPAFRNVGGGGLRAGIRALVSTPAQPESGAHGVLAPMRALIPDGGAMQLSPLEGWGRRGRGGGAHGKIKPLSAAGRNRYTGYGSLRIPRLQARLGAGRGGGVLQQLMPLAAVRMEGGFWRPEFQQFMGMLLPLMGQGRGLKHERGGLQASMHPALLGMASEGAYAAAALNLMPMLLSGVGRDASLIVATEYLMGSTKASVSMSYLVRINERLQPVDAVTVQASLLARSLESVGVEQTLQAMGLLSADAVEYVYAAELTRSDLVGAGGRLLDTSAAWAVNMRTDASTRYESYRFNSYARIGGKLYGAKPDGIYALEGADDQGQPVRWSLHLGEHDFGTRALKSVPTAYVGVASDGQVLLKVGDGKSSYVYQMRRNDARMKTQRFDLGRGLRANYFTFELLGEDGGDFELDEVQFEVLPLARRI